MGLRSSSDRLDEAGEVYVLTEADRDVVIRFGLRVGEIAKIGEDKYCQTEPRLVPIYGEVVGAYSSEMVADEVLELRQACVDWLIRRIASVHGPVIVTAVADGVIANCGVSYKSKTLQLALIMLYLHLFGEHE
jgi:hypothetical protein